MLPVALPVPTFASLGYRYSKLAADFNPIYIIRWTLVYDIPIGEIAGRNHYARGKMAEQEEKVKFCPLIADTYT